MKIAIDFDGTCVRHEFPEIGEDCPNAVEVMHELIEQGHELTLFTMRSGIYLDEALRWFKDADIHLEGVQYEKNQTSWTSSNKCYAQVYIDDAALGAPLIYEEGKLPYVDWLKVRELLLRVDENANPIIGS